MLFAFDDREEEEKERFFEEDDDDHSQEEGFEGGGEAFVVVDVVEKIGRCFTRREKRTSETTFSKSGEGRTALFFLFLRR